MMDSKELNRLIADYLMHNQRPSRKGLAEWLNISPTTIFRIMSGNYRKNCPYTKDPHYNRTVNNNDFSAIRSVFEERTRNGDNI